MQYQRISADCHLDMIWLPRDLFTSQAARALKEEMPYVKEQPDGTKRWIDNNGADYGKAGGVGAVGSEYVPGKQLRVDKMHEAGLYEDYKTRGGADPATPTFGSRNSTATVSMPKSSTAFSRPARR